jgi:hypothetical protein
LGGGYLSNVVAGGSLDNLRVVFKSEVKNSDFSEMINEELASNLDVSH